MNRTPCKTRWFAPIAATLLLTTVAFASSEGDAGGEGAPPAWPEALPSFEDRSFDGWHELVFPSKDELAWQSIPWRASFWEAVVEADRQRRPVVLWAMNGHPLGCT